MKTRGALQIRLTTVMLLVAVFGMLVVFVVHILPYLFRPPRRPSQQLSCINNLRLIDSAKEQWAMARKKTDGDPVVVDEVNRYIKGNTTPVCWGGGRYSYNAIGSDPTCAGVTVTSHKLPEL